MPEGPGTVSLLYPSGTAAPSLRHSEALTALAVPGLLSDRSGGAPRFRHSGQASGGPSAPAVAARATVSERRPGRWHDEPVPSTPTRLVLLRHGESRSNAEFWLSGSRTCKGLTERGAWEATRLGEALRADPTVAPDRVLSSSLPRALETAALCTTELGVPVESRDQLIERTPGECEGMTVAEYTDRYGHRPWSDWRQPLSPGGESEPEFAARVRAAFEVLIEEGRGMTTWVVCHGGVVMTSADHLLGTPGGLDKPRWAAPANASITEWVRAPDDEPDGPWRLRRYNDHAHLVLAGGPPGGQVGGGPAASLV